jgi:hypothetical protein
MTPTPGQPLPIRDIHLPPDISWWPPATGWWYLLGAVFLLSTLGFLLVRWYKKGALKREAKTKIQHIEAGFRRDDDHLKLSKELSALLRRIAISTQPRDMVAGLTGESWLQFLDEHNPNNTEKTGTDFQKGAGRILITAPYQLQVDKGEVEGLLTLCKIWIEKNSYPRFGS